MPSGFIGIYGDRFSAAIQELADAGFIAIETRNHIAYYDLTLEGWTALGSPAEIAFPEF
jgi:hypothetical protein